MRPSGQKELVGHDYSNSETFDGDFAFCAVDLTVEDVSFLIKHKNITPRGKCPDTSNVTLTIKDVRKAMDKLQCEGCREKERKDNTPYQKGDDWCI